MVNSINYSDIVLYKTAHECAQFGRMIDHILKLCGIDSIESNIIIYKGNAACVAQMKTSYT